MYENKIKRKTSTRDILLDNETAYLTDYTAIQQVGLSLNKFVLTHGHSVSNVTGSTLWSKPVSSGYHLTRTCFSRNRRKRRRSDGGRKWKGAAGSGRKPYRVAAGCFRRTLISAAWLWTERTKQCSCWCSVAYRVARRCYVDNATSPAISALPRYYVGPAPAAAAAAAITASVKHRPDVRPSVRLPTCLSVPRAVPD